MKTFYLALKYNGRYLLIITSLFFVFWHFLSVHQKVCQINSRTTTIIEQNILRFKTALIQGNAQEAKQVLWSIKLPVMPFVKIDSALSRELWYEPMIIGDPAVTGLRYISHQFTATEHGLSLGTISYALDLFSVNLNTFGDNLFLYAMFLVLITLGLVMASLGTVGAMVRLEAKLGNIENKWTNPETWTSNIVFRRRVTGLEKRFELFTQKIIEAFRNAAVVEFENSANKKVVDVAQQLSHDIRSPLAALSVATSDLKEVPEERRILIRSAVQRIEDIANDLASKKEGTRDQRPGAGGRETEVRGRRSENEEEKRSTHHLTSIIQTIISEKRTEHQQRTNVRIELQCAECAYNYFTKIQPSEFKRILSNIINNSYEAIKEQGEIIVSVVDPSGSTTLSERSESKGQSCLLVSVRDNGTGIPAEKLPHLMQRGVSFGKEKGQGLGLYHAKETIESWGGSIAIESQEGFGTTVTLSLPRQPVPGWFVSEIQITNDQHVVILDDDESIHLVWKGRLREHGIGEDHVHHFTKPDQLIEWHRKSYTTPIRPNGHLPPSMGKEHLFLCDYELLGCLKTGLDVIKELGIAHQSILVTSHYEEKEIRDECKRLGIKLLPKSLAGFVPLHVTSHQPLAANTFDAILIDDEEIIHTTWALVAKMKQKKIAHFRHPNEFLNSIDKYSPQTAIYIDSDLGNGVKGEIAAQEIFYKGFKEIYLCTGSEPKEYPEMPWIRKIVGKGVPFG